MTTECEITKIVEFDSGHRIPSHESKCRHLHGHRYRLEATVIGPIQDVKGQTDDGMVMDFSAIKKVMMELVHDKWDHALLLYDKDPLHVTIHSGFPDMHIELLPIIPTAENLAALAYTILFKRLKDEYGIKLKRVRLYETPNGWADYSGPVLF